MKCQHGNAITLQSDYGVITYNHTEDSQPCPYLNHYGLTTSQCLRLQLKGLDQSPTSTAIFLASRDARQLIYTTLSKKRDDKEITAILEAILLTLKESTLEDAILREMLTVFGVTLRKNLAKMGCSNQVVFSAQETFTTTKVLPLKELSGTLSDLDVAFNEANKNFKPVRR